MAVYNYTVATIKQLLPLVQQGSLLVLLPCAACRRLAGCRRPADKSKRFVCQPPQTPVQLNAPQV